MPPATLFARLSLLIALVAPPAAALADGDALSRIAKAGVVRIAVPDNFPPFGTLGTDEKLHGYDIDTAELIADGLGATLQLLAVPSTGRIAALTDGKVDLVISTLGKDPEREKAIDFSVSYAPFFSGVFGPQRLAVTGPGDLAGKTIAVTRGTIEENALARAAPAAAIKRYDDNAGTEVAYLSNQTELIATGNSVAAEVFEKSPLKKTVLKFVLRNSPCYVGIAKGEPGLLARVDAILGAARKDGRLDAISRHWLGAPIGDPEHPDALAGK